MPHSVEAAFVQAQEADTRFVIVQGRLDFTRGQVPKVQNTPPEMTLIEGRLTGSSLSTSGFSTPYANPVTIALACFGPWCPDLQQGGQVLAFVAVGPAGNVIATNPCGGYLFDNPTGRMISAVKSCFAGKACTPLR